MNHLNGSYLYFVQAGKDSPINIGSSSDLTAAIADLQQGSPHELTVLGVILDPNEKQLEKRLHQQFKALWIRGDWFSADTQLLEYIAANAVAPESIENPDLDLDQLMWLEALQYHEPQPLMTLQELAANLQLHEATLARYVRAGTIPCLRIGRQIRFYPPAIYEYLRELTPLVKTIEDKYGVDPFVPTGDE